MSFPTYFAACSPLSAEIAVRHPITTKEFCLSPKIEHFGKCQAQVPPSVVLQNTNKGDLGGVTGRSRLRTFIDEHCPPGHVLCGFSHMRRRCIAK